LATTRGGVCRLLAGTVDSEKGISKVAGVFVVGSINQDLVLAVERRPKPGETVTGADLSMHPGGKGANQAVAAALLGASVALLGRVGGDPFGESLLSELRRKNVNARYVERISAISSGMAFITITPDGENAIVVSPGANHHLEPSDVEAASAAIQEAGVLVVQMELELGIVCRAAQVAVSGGTRVLMNLAPYREVPPSLLQQTDLLVVNEHEATALLGSPIRGIRQAVAAAPELLSMGARSAVITLGASGAVVASADSKKHLPAPTVPVVDTTAAGDAFVGALAVKLARGTSLEDAATYAVKAGAATVTKMGAQSSLPTPEILDTL